jgi:WhiB family redox-sensing transcriptional regulator
VQDCCWLELTELSDPYPRICNAVSHQLFTTVSRHLMSTVRFVPNFPTNGSVLSGSDRRAPTTSTDPRQSAHPTDTQAGTRLRRRIEECLPMDWRHRAICRDEDPELFFPVGNSGPALLQIAEAKAVCQRCPVTSECLAWALETGQDAGVWGAMSEDERRSLKRRRARARARSL